MFDQRAQDCSGRDAAEVADKGPIVGAGPALPATVAGHDPRGVVEEVLGFCEH
jgi:hypothetical protein